MNVVAALRMPHVELEMTEHRPKQQGQQILSVSPNSGSVARSQYPDTNPFVY